LLLGRRHFREAPSAWASAKQRVPRRSSRNLHKEGESNSEYVKGYGGRSGKEVTRKKLGKRRGRNDPLFLLERQTRGGKKV